MSDVWLEFTRYHDHALMTVRASAIDGLIDEERNPDIRTVGLVVWGQVIPVYADYGELCGMLANGAKRLPSSERINSTGAPPEIAQEGSALAAARRLARAWTPDGVGIDDGPHACDECGDECSTVDPNQTPALCEGCRCWTCEGRGVVRERVMCALCNGEGWQPDGMSCTQCVGSGTVNGVVICRACDGTARDHTDDP